MGEPAERIDPAQSEPGAPPAAEAGAGAPRVLDTAQKAGAIDLATALRLIAERHGQSFQQTVVEMAKLSFGAGKVTIGEYIDFGLFRKGLNLEQKRAYVGLTAMRQIWDSANFLRDWWGLIENKLAATSLLGSWGFPVIPTKGVYSEAFRIPALPPLANRAELLSFLRDPARYPLFGKPIDSLRSLGSASFSGYDAATDSLVRTTGGAIAAEAFADEVLEAYAAGYIFQGRVVPHAEIRAVCGDRLATVRVVTVLMGGAPKAIRTLWKIPAGDNVADNFWRKGNMIAELDRATGRVLRVQRGTGLNGEDVTHHADTGAPLVGRTVPLYGQLVAMAVEAHRMFPDVGLIGWDMAATEAGALIVEPNITPDFVLPQLADGRGIMDDEFKAFLAERRAAKDALKAGYKKAVAADTRWNHLQRLTGSK